MCTLYIRRFVNSSVLPHTRKKDGPKSDSSSKTKKKIHETDKNASRALVDAVHDDNQCQIDRKSKVACINYKTSTVGTIQDTGILY